jgi:hypothetical protein
VEVGGVESGCTIAGFGDELLEGPVLVVAIVEAGCWGAGMVEDEMVSEVNPNVGVITERYFAHFLGGLAAMSDPLKW